MTDEEKDDAIHHHHHQHHSATPSTTSVVSSAPPVLPGPSTIGTGNNKYNDDNYIHDPKGRLVPVVLVHKQNAKTAKVTLERKGLVDKRFRMVAAAAAEEAVCDCSTKQNRGSWVAIPILVGVHVTAAAEATTSCIEPFSFIEARGVQFCPYSSAMLGNRRHLMDHNGDATDYANLSISQAVLFQMMTERIQHHDDDPSRSLLTTKVVLDAILRLDTVNVCPSKLETLGDDRTLVIPPKAFAGDDFEAVLQMGRSTTSDDNDDDDIQDLMDAFWKRLAVAHKSRRIISRGRIDPNSKIRESGHRLVWPSQGIPSTSGPSTASSWICVTEQGIRQSFDVTRVMFSRGNVSEKIRFGQTLVQEGEVVLDMYAGIGYYTLPAVIHGRAERVYACEWNQYAAQALLYNVKDNGMQEKVKIFVGDCRELAIEHNLLDLVDRVSLGLLPSSEGGWKTAVRALKNATGGWLHVHGNVPNKERDDWALWLCSRLNDFTQETGKPANWVVLCSHVERVKSFAPTVSHYVADVFLGPPERHLFGDKIQKAHAAFGVLKDQGTLITATKDTKATQPSCALSADGVLFQGWMR